MTEYRCTSFRDIDPDHEASFFKQNRRSKRLFRMHTRSTRPKKQYQLSNHAHLRAAQRGLSRWDIDYILSRGQLYRAANAAIYFLRGKDIPESEYHEMSRLEGTAVIMTKARSTIITIWRNRKNGIRNIRHKTDIIEYNG
jgi:hypothetical protein